MNNSGTRLSKVSKLDGIRSWSLEAGTTCPGSLGEDGNIVAACQGCYAKGGNYRYPNVKAPRAVNRMAWRADSWADDMVAELDNDRYFRWFDSGDVYHPELAKKILEVMTRTPWVKHWLPTRSHKLSRIKPILEAMARLDNVKVRYSSDSVTGEYMQGLHGSTIIPDSENVPAGVTMCEAYNNGGKCSGCRKCWDKSVDVIGYVTHGKAMSKVIRIHLAA